MAYLHRGFYRKDTDPAEPEYRATKSSTIPDRVFKRDGWQIVGVDWDSDPEWVMVTFLIPGEDGISG